MKFKNLDNLHGSFFPLICEFKCPNYVINLINDHINNISLKENERWKKYNLLNRDISNIFLTKKFSDENEITQFCESVGNQYLKLNNIINQNCKLLLAPELKEHEYVDCWVNRYYYSEYTPAHIHNNCDLSGVIFLKLSDKLISNYCKREDGSLQFFINTNKGIEIYKPIHQIGRILIFPSNLIHLVYPQKDSSERRTLSFNLVVR